VAFRNWRVQFLQLLHAGSTAELLLEKMIHCAINVAVCMQESGECDHQTEDAVHEQQGCSEENAGRRRQRVPGMRLR